jgi:hypothetical protein
MKRKTFGTIAAIALGAALAMPAYAAQKQGSMPMGKEIHKSSVDGYTLAYRLIDTKQKMEAMKGMKGMSMQNMDMSKMKSHHLMVYIADPGGKEIEGGKVGFMVTGPDGKVQKVMAMGMESGMGADVDMKDKGKYEIKMKAVVGGKIVMDHFTYEVK